MDPNETLARIRQLARGLFDPRALYYRDAAALWEMLEAFNDLDDWIMKTGFLPDEWASSYLVRLSKGE